MAHTVKHSAAYHKNRALQNLEEARKLLFYAYVGIEELNSGGRQFDYVTDPKLSEAVDKIKARIDIINKIVYQKK